jgi:hypothetical protein
MLEAQGEGSAAPRTITQGLASEPPYSLLHQLCVCARVRVSVCVLGVLKHTIRKQRTNRNSHGACLFSVTETGLGFRQPGFKPVCSEQVA